MDHFCKKVPGWFTFPYLYKSAVQWFDNALFVEIGSWLGQSSSFMGVEIINSNKNIKMDCIDIWEKSDDYDLPVLENVNLEHLFKQNTWPVRSVITAVKSNSLEAAKKYKDESIDFIFIDGSHYFIDVLNDMVAWWPKLKPGGLFAGHDYTNTIDVKNAVDAWLLLNNRTLEYNEEQCWAVAKQPSQWVPPQIPPQTQK